MVTETARAVVACSNAGNYRAQMALFTDEGVQFFGPEESEATEEDIHGFVADTPVEPLPADTSQFVLASLAVQMAAEFETPDPPPPTAWCQISKTVVFETQLMWTSAVSDPSPACFADGGADACDLREPDPGVRTPAT